MHIPRALSEPDEWRAIRRLQGDEVKEALVTWLLGLAVWHIRADLTFASLAGPERAERAVTWWLSKVAPTAFAVIGYERQQRGAVHAHLVLNRDLDIGRAVRIWNKIAGWCRIEPIESQEKAVAYIIKHAVKDLNVDLLGVVSSQPRLYDHPSVVHQQKSHKRVWPVLSEGG